MKKKPARAEYAFQLLIVLAGTDPLVWRRIQVPGDYSFWDLHVAIQDTMGWEDYHLHEFTAGRPGEPALTMAGMRIWASFCGPVTSLPDAGPTPFPPGPAPRSVSGSGSEGKAIAKHSSGSSSSTGSGRKASGSKRPGRRVDTGNACCRVDGLPSQKTVVERVIGL